MAHVVLRQERSAVIDDERRLVQRELPDPVGKRASRLEREDGAGGMTEHEGLPARRDDQGFDVLDLAFDRVRRRVAAVAPAPAVVGDHGEARCELSGQLRGGRTIGQRAADQDERRSVTRPIERDRGAVFRGDFHRHPRHHTDRCCEKWVATCGSSVVPSEGRRTLEETRSPSMGGEKQESRRSHPTIPFDRWSQRQA